MMLQNQCARKFGSQGCCLRSPVCGPTCWHCHGHSRYHALFGNLLLNYNYHHHDYVPVLIITILIAIIITPVITIAITILNISWISNLIC